MGKKKSTNYRKFSIMVTFERTILCNKKKNKVSFLNLFKIWDDDLKILRPICILPLTITYYTLTIQANLIRKCNKNEKHLFVLILRICIAISHLPPFNLYSLLLSFKYKPVFGNTPPLTQGYNEISKHHKMFSHKISHKWCFYTTRLPV